MRWGVFIPSSKGYKLVTKCPGLVIMQYVNRVLVWIYTWVQDSLGHFLQSDTVLGIKPRSSSVIKHSGPSLWPKRNIVLLIKHLQYNSNLTLTYDVFVALMLSRHWSTTSGCCGCEQNSFFNSVVYKLCVWHWTWNLTVSFAFSLLAYLF